MTVLAPPTISVLNRTVLVSVGEIATMRCSAEGIPQPNITWMKNGIQVTFTKARDTCI